MTSPPARVVRLRDGRVIAATLRGRDRRAGSLLVLHSRTRTDDHVAIGYVASKRVGNAVQRNRAKRLLREASQRVRWAAGHDIVLVARAAAAAASMQQVHAELERLAVRRGVAVPAPAVSA